MTALPQSLAAGPRSAQLATQQQEIVTVTSGRATRQSVWPRALVLAPQCNKLDKGCGKMAANGQTLSLLHNNKTAIAALHLKGVVACEFPSTPEAEWETAHQNGTIAV